MRDAGSRHRSTGAEAKLAAGNHAARAERVGAPRASEAREPASPRLGVVAALVFCSGACGLVYQTAWLRDLRLVFGASTPATAAALAVFMGGLGLGAARFGARADRHPAPLRLYGLLELGIAAAAAL